MQSDPREVIRGTAAWALGKIGGEAAAEALYKAAEQEQSEEVMAEIRKESRCCSRSILCGKGLFPGKKRKRSVSTRLQEKKNGKGGMIKWDKR